MKPDRLLVIFFALAILGAFWRSWWLHNEARGIAEEWLREHKYKVISVKVGFFGGLRFGVRFFRRTDNITHFRCVVEDAQLGGRGVLWLRVLTDRLGLLLRDPEMRWEIEPHNPDPLSFVPVEDKLETAQRDLLRRIAHGETRFSAPRYPREGEEPFDALVEHLKAMQVRGFIAISTPQRSRVPGSTYELVEFAELTEEGRAYLATFD